MLNIGFELLPHRAALRAGQDNTLDVLVRAAAPERTDQTPSRSPLNLGLVIDRSGSMSGRPLDEAKRCAGMIIDALGTGDRASLVVYDSNVNVLVPAQPMLDRTLFHAALRGIEPGGNTALHDGWLKGAEQAAVGADDARRVSRVLLLSDGQANAGLTSIGTIAEQCAHMAEVGVSTSTYGLGQGFNEDLMTAMARAGRGNAYYGQCAEDLIDPFRQEFDLMAALCARSLRLALSPARGVHIEVANDYPKDAEGRPILPDLAHGSEAWAILRLTVPRDFEVTASDGAAHVVTASLLYKDLDGRDEVAGTVHLRLPYLSAGAHAAVTPNELVARRAAELRAAALQEQARLAARRDDWREVDALLGRLRQEANLSPWLGATVAYLEQYARQRETEPFAKEARYKARAMQSRLAALNEEADWAPHKEALARSYVRRKPEQGKRMDPDAGGEPSQ